MRTMLMCSVSASMFMALAAPASAQDGAAGEEDTIVVTGSLIPRQDLQATSPMTVVGSEDLTLSNTVNNEEFLNTLPQTIPGFDQTSNNPGLGEATVDLRGLGMARTLVLVNGRRWVSSNQNPGVVDLNSIPASMIDRIEIVTGGASATYGSDAIAGVVNFIMKDDFEGIQLDTSFEFTEELDGEIFDASLTVGTNFDNGRGNVTFFGSYTNREAVFQGDRPDTAVTLVDAGTGLSQTGSVNIPSGFVLDFNPDFSAGPDPVDTLPCLGEGFGSVDGGGFCTTPGAVDDDFVPGWIFNPNGSGVLPHIDFGPNTTRYNYAPVNYLQLPQDRFSIAGFSHYDVTDDVEAYFRGVWTQSNVKQALAPTPVFTTLTINADNPFVGDPLHPNQVPGGGDAQAWEMIENNDPSPNPLAGPFCGDFDANGVDDCLIVVGRRMLELGPRISDVRNNSFQLAGGFRGTFWDDWGWDVYGAYAAADSTLIQTGNVSISAWQEEVREGRANLFEEGGLSPDVVEAIERTGAIVGRTQQTVLNGSFYGNSGDFKSPMADSPISFAGGLEYRREQLDALPDSVLGPDVAGFNQAPEVHGSFFVWEAFGELKVPLLENKPFAEELTAEVKYRYSDYSSLSDTVDTYAYGGTWTPISGLKFRGQFQRAVRAPNIGELFSPMVNGFPNVEDPCSSGNGSYDELVAGNPGLAAVLQANCTADGVPGGTVGTPFQVNSQIEGLSGGNPDLNAESSDTWTVGVVVQPDAVPDLSLTVDYYNVTVTDAITAIPVQELFDTCYIEGLASSCALIDRTPGGLVDIFRSNQQNIASIKASGIDVQLNYAIELADMGLPDWGRFSVYVLGSWVESAAFEVTREVECVGLYAGSCTEPTPEFRVNTRFDWSMGPWLARVRWRWIDAVTDVACVEGCGLFVPGVDSKNYVDLTMYYQATDNVLLGFGVQNVFGTDLVLVGDSSAEQSNTYPASYETLGRHFFFRTQLKF